MDTLKLVLILAVLIVVAFVVYDIVAAFTGAGSAINRAIDRVFGPSEVITPKKVQEFMDQPANQSGGYTPWVPADNIDPYDDGSGVPTWVKKKSDSF